MGRRDRTPSSHPILRRPPFRCPPKHQPVPPHRRDVGTVLKRIKPRPPDLPEIRTRQRKRQERRPQRLRYRNGPPLECREMLGRQRRHRRHGAPRRSRILAFDERSRRRAGRGKDIPRHIALAACAMQRDQPDQPGDRLRAAGMSGGFGDRRRRLRIEDHRRHLDQRRSSLAAIALEPGAAGHGIVVEVEDAGIEIVVERLFRQAVAADRRQQGLGERMACALAPGNGVAPPLQADLARQRLAHAVTHRCDLGVECIERKQRGPLVLGRIEHRKVAVAVGGPDGLDRPGLRLGHGSAG